MNDSGDKSMLVRRIREAAAFAVIIAVFWTVDTMAKRNLRMVDGVGPDDFRLFAEQATSAFTVWILVPAVAWWLTRFPISAGQVPSKIAGHILGSVLFAVAHNFIMLGLRVLLYPLFGTTYVFSDFWFHNLVIEYQKDIKIYVAIVAIITIYRLAMERRRQRPGTDRLVVQSGSGERLLNFEEIECLEASRNYVSVFVDDKEYLLRETIANLEVQLQERGFIRTHRSYLVKTDAIKGVKPNDSGGQNLLLESGREVPLSRGRRDEVRALLGI